ncbi:hypothetical protein MKX01_030785 [Papaver californicum]|nr:hypothetical protein MKX01_030785 [Papaver californicum]
MTKAPLSTVVMGVLILGLFLAQASVEAKSCSCVRRTGATQLCARDCGCLFTRQNRCPSSHPCKTLSLEVGDDESEQSNVDENKINEYCKLGCAFSVCENKTTPQESVVLELDGAVERCNDACFELSNKNSNIAVVTA